VGPRFSGKVREEPQRRERKWGEKLAAKDSAISLAKSRELAVELEGVEGLTNGMARHSCDDRWALWGHVGKFRNRDIRSRPTGDYLEKRSINMPSDSTFLYTITLAASPDLHRSMGEVGGWGIPPALVERSSFF
jgi:hypothetical protein